MPLKSAPVGVGQISAHLTSFDPDGFIIVIEHREARGLALSGEPEEYIRRFAASVRRRQDEDADVELGEEVAQLRFSHVAFSEYGGDGAAVKFDFADSVSGELLEVAEAVFDDEGAVREELDNAGVSRDILHIESVEVSPNAETHELVRHAIEHIISRYGHGCGAAVFYQANWESIGVARPLKDRGFVQTPSNRNVWVADLGRVRPPLHPETSSACRE